LLSLDVTTAVIVNLEDLGCSARFLRTACGPQPLPSDYSSKCAKEQRRLKFSFHVLPEVETEGDALHDRNLRLLLDVI
jgi:hypothetical protein